MKTDTFKNKEKGQVLVFAIVIIVVLMVATIFLFDLHSIIRSKIKLETAEQSAALAAAKWQAKSLNMIGEINYVKAVDTLLDNIPTEGETDAEQISSANKTLTEMQSRISFCGPLIAFGAAQQAAKNNGININSNGYVKTVYSDFENYLDKLDPSSVYYNYGDVDEYLNYFKWRDPYVNMLRAISSQGLAVRPNGRFPGIESVDPPWLDYESLYDAVLNGLWCNPYLNAISKYPDSYWNGKWYNVDFEHTSFPNESEIYTLGVRFTGTGVVGYSTLQNAMQDVVSMASEENLQPVSWCAYDSKWNRYLVDGTTENLNYNGPNNDGLNYWSRGMFLRDDLKPSMFYGGATAYAECYQHINLMSRYKSRMATPYGKDHPYAGTDQEEKAKFALQNDVIRKTPSRSLKVGNDSATDSDSGGAVAKPLGELPDGSPPTEAVIVLPVFKNVALIPSSMQKCRPLRVTLTDLERFLIWLSTVDDIHSPPSAPPQGTEHFLIALQKLDDDDFRKSGWNNDYVRNDSDVTIYFFDSYKYDPNSNQSGAGWLQQIWVGTDTMMDEEASRSTVLEEQQAGWNTRIYRGKKYILRDRNGNLVTNEQMICRWTPAGPGVIHPGTRIGPPHL